MFGFRMAFLPTKNNPKESLLGKPHPIDLDYRSLMISSRKITEDHSYLPNWSCLIMVKS